MRRRLQRRLDTSPRGGWSRRGKLYTGSGSAADDARIIDPATEPARVRAMFVHPDWTRRGLGTRILEACQAAAKAEGFTSLAPMATLPGVPLYERFGFRVREQTQIPMPDGTSIGSALMDKSIPQSLTPVVGHSRRDSRQPHAASAPGVMP